MAKNKKGEKPDVSKNVMDQIHSGQVKMRPKIYFITGAVLLGVGTGMLIMLSMLILSMVSFHMRHRGTLDYLQFGRAGLPPFIHNFPWMYLIILGLALYGGWKLVRTYDFSHKYNVWGVLIGFVALIITMSVVLDQAGTHQRLMSRREFQPFYRQEFTGENWLVGQINSMEGNNIVLITPEGKQVLVDRKKAKTPPLYAKRAASN